MHTDAKQAHEQDTWISLTQMYNYTYGGVCTATVRALRLAHACTNMLFRARMPGPIPFTHKLRYVHLCLYTSRHVHTDKFKDAHLYRHEHLHTHVGAMHTSTRAKKHLYTCDGGNDWGQGTWPPRAGAAWESTAVRMSREEVTEEPIPRRGHPSSLSPTAPESRFWAEPRGPPLGRAPAYRPSERRPSYSRNVPPKAPRVNQPWPPRGRKSQGCSRSGEGERVSAY